MAYPAKHPQQGAMTRALGRAIKTARNQAGLSQDGLAALIDVKQQTVSDWEAGRTAPSLSRMMAVSEITNVPVSRIYAAAEAAMKIANKGETTNG